MSGGGKEDATESAAEGTDDRSDKSCDWCDWGESEYDDGGSDQVHCRRQDRVSLAKADNNSREFCSPMRGESAPRCRGILGECANVVQV